MNEDNQPPSDFILTDSSDKQASFIENHGIPPLLFAFIVLIFIFFLYQIIGGVITIALLGMQPTYENLSGYRIATGLGQLLFILVPTFLFARLATTNQREYLRLKMPDIRVFVASFFGILSLQQLLQIYLVFQESLPLPHEIRDLSDKFKDLFDSLYKILVGSSSIPELLWVIVIVALIPSVAEEFMFRGLVQRSMEKGLTPLWGAVTTGVIFGAYHLNPFSFVPLAAIGIYLGFLTVRSGSIWISVVTHFINNAMACIALYLNMKDDFIIVGNANEMPSGQLMISFWLFGVLFLVSTYYVHKITKPRNEVASAMENGEKIE